MKKILLATLLLIPFLGIAQTTKPIDGFLGIKFGSNKATVMAALKAKGAIYNKENSTADKLLFANVKLGTHITLGLFVCFVNDKAFEADYIFDPELEAKTIPEYESIVADITKAYGDGKDKKLFNSPYEKDEELNLTLLGLSNGKITFSTYWADANRNTILASITPKMTVQLKYQCDALADEFIKKQDAKQKADF